MFRAKQNNQQYKNKIDKQLNMSLMCKSQITEANDNWSHIQN